jgi:FkbM family methyltransferase
MKYVEAAGLWFPSTEEHFLGKTKKGRPAYLDYQQDRLDAAYAHTNGWEVAVDVGAHVGLVTRALAKRFKRVVSFEPHPETFACLVKNTQHLSNVECVNAAVADTDAAVWVENHRTPNSGDRQIVLNPEKHANASVAVGAIRLDDYPLRRVDLLKIDVQGYEGRVLAGAANTLCAFAPTVLVEVEPRGKLRHQFDKDGAVDRGLVRMGAKLRTTIGADRVYAFGPDGAHPYSKYEARGAYHWVYYENGKTRATVDAVVAYIRAQGHKLIVDLGCGDGLFAAKLAERGGPEVVGIDNNSTAVKLARQKGVTAHHQNIYYATASFNRVWPDAVCLFDTLEHLHKPELALAVVRELAPVCYVLNPDPNGSVWHTREFPQDEFPAFAAANGWTAKLVASYVITGKNHKTLFHLTRA